MLKKQHNKISVLIVEDNLVNQKVLERQLKGQGFQVHVANHGGEALALIERSSFWKDPKPGVEIVDLTVVLMDQEMPTMDGLEATKHIREWEKEGKLKAHIPIIGVTANARKEQIGGLLDAGMVSHQCNGFVCTYLISHRTT